MLLRCRIWLAAALLTATSANALPIKPKLTEETPISWANADAYFAGARCGSLQVAVSVSNRGPRNLTHVAGRVFVAAEYGAPGTPVAAFAIDETIFPGGNVEICVNFDATKLGGVSAFDLFWNTTVTGARTSSEAGNILNPVEMGFGSGAK